MIGKPYSPDSDKAVTAADVYATEDLRLAGAAAWKEFASADSHIRSEAVAALIHSIVTSGCAKHATEFGSAGPVFVEGFLTSAYAYSDKAWNAIKRATIAYAAKQGQRFHVTPDGSIESFDRIVKRRAGDLAGTGDLAGKLESICIGDPAERLLRAMYEANEIVFDEMLVGDRKTGYGPLLIDGTRTDNVYDIEAWTAITDCFFRLRLETGADQHLTLTVGEKRNGSSFYSSIRKGLAMVDNQIACNSTSVDRAAVDRAAVDRAAVDRAATIKKLAESFTALPKAREEWAVLLEKMLDADCVYRYDTRGVVIDGTYVSAPLGTSFVPEAWKMFTDAAIVLRPQSAVFSTSTDTSSFLSSEHFQRIHDEIFGWVEDLGVRARNYRRLSRWLGAETMLYFNNGYVKRDDHQDDVRISLSQWKKVRGAVLAHKAAHDEPWTESLGFLFSEAAIQDDITTLAPIARHACHMLELDPGNWDSLLSLVEAAESIDWHDGQIMVDGIAVDIGCKQIEDRFVDRMFDLVATMKKLRGEIWTCDGDGMRPTGDTGDDEAGDAGGDEESGASLQDILGHIGGSVAPMSGFEVRLKKESNMGKDDSVGSVVKDEALQAFGRASTEEFADFVRGPVVMSLLKDSGVGKYPMVKTALKAFLETRFGEGVFSWGLGVTIPLVRKSTESLLRRDIDLEMVDRLAAELRVSGQTAVLRPVIRALAQPLHDYVTGRLSPRVRVGDHLDDETDRDEAGEAVEHEERASARAGGAASRKK